MIKLLGKTRRAVLPALFVPILFATNTFAISYCVSPGSAISPDPGVLTTSDVVIGQGGTIADVDVRIELNSKLQNLTATLTHVDTGTTITLFKDIRYPAPSSLPCDQFGMAARFDDPSVTNDPLQASYPKANESCTNLSPSVQGGVKPMQLTTPFVSENLAGTWRLSVHYDLAYGAPPSTLQKWCVIPIFKAPFDNFSYRALDSETAGGPTPHFVNISTTGLKVVQGDSSTSSSPAPNGIGAPIVLSTPFKFYGITYSALTMSAKGYLTTDVSDVSNDSANQCPLPAQPVLPIGTQGARIIPLHGDLYTGAGYYQSFANCPRPYDGGGAIGCQIFQWHNAKVSFTTDAFDFEAILYNNYDIIFEYAKGVTGNTQGGRYTSTGIQGPASGNSSQPPAYGLVYDCNDGAAPHDNLSIWLFQDLNHDGFPDHQDNDQDGTPNHDDACPTDPAKSAPGICGCGVADSDQNSNGVIDCYYTSEFRSRVNDSVKFCKAISLKKGKITKAGKAAQRQLKASFSSLKSYGTTAGINLKAKTNLPKLIKSADGSVKKILAKNPKNFAKTKSTACKALQKVSNVLVGQ